MRRLAVVAVLALAPLVAGCADRSGVSPSAPPNLAPSSAAPASPTPTVPATQEPIGLLPDDCQLGPEPVPVSDHVGNGIGGDPAWAIGFGGPGATLGVTPDDPHEDHGWLRKVLWLLRRSAPDPVTVTGIRLDDGTALWFDYRDRGSQGTTLVLDPAAPDGQQGGWFEYRGYFVVPSAGCYRLTAAWPGGGWDLDFRAGLDPSLS